MAKHIICLRGCDDSTVVEMELTDHQFEAMQELVRLATEASDYPCMPTIRLDGDKLRPPKVREYEGE